MPQALHDRELRAGDCAGNSFAHRWRTGILVFAGEQRDLATTGVHASNGCAPVTVVAVEIDVALVYAGPRLAVVPPVLASVRLGTMRRVEAVGVAGGKLAPVDRRVMQELVVAAGRVGAAF